MNCKQGDLAVIVRSVCGNEGRIVRCVRFTGHALYENGEVCASWWIEPAVIGNLGWPTNVAPDECLRPIRDQDGEDEILRIAGKPQEVTA